MGDEPAKGTGQALDISALRDIFAKIDQLAALKANDREIFDRLFVDYQQYSRRLIRWLVRHALHPEVEDDLMPDEVQRCEEFINAEGATIADVFFRRIPCTIEPQGLVQYKYTFWRVVEFLPEQSRARLQLLAEPG